MQHKHQHIPIHQVMKAFHWQHQPDEAKWLQLHLHRSKQLGRLKMRHPKNPPKNGPFFRRTIGFGVPQFSDMPKCVGLTNNNRKTIGCIHIYIYGLTDAIAKNKWTLFANNKFTNKLDFREKQSTLSPSLGWKRAGSAPIPPPKLRTCPLWLPPGFFNHIPIF